MDLDTTEKTISVIVGVVTLGGVLYGLFRAKVNRFVRRAFTRRRWHKHAKKCPRCGALHARGTAWCGRCNFQFPRPKKQRGRRG
jgi:hypothetical protein